MSHITAAILFLLPCIDYALSYQQVHSGILLRQHQIKKKKKIFFVVVLKILIAADWTQRTLFCSGRPGSETLGIKSRVGDNHKPTVKCLVSWVPGSSGKQKFPLVVKANLSPSHYSPTTKALREQWGKNVAFFPPGMLQKLSWKLVTI